MQEKEAVFVFPGQGTQTIGMGADLARDFSVAKLVFEEVDDALHQKLSQLMFSGEMQELSLTQNAQPAIMAVSVAVFRVLRSEGFLVPVAMAGHSLGEYSALCVADVLGLTSTAQLLQARGQAMAKACEMEQGGMLALLGATTEQAKEVAKQADCYVANDNTVGQVVLSGLLKNLDKAKEISEKMGIKRSVLLNVKGAFHSPLMQQAADELAPLLQLTSFKTPKIPVYFNVTANIDLNPDHYADLLKKQVTSPVRWRELIENTKSKCFVECGVGGVLSGLIRRIISDAEITSVGSSEDINKLVKMKK